MDGECGPQAEGVLGEGKMVANGGEEEEGGCVEEENNPQRRACLLRVGANYRCRGGDGAPAADGRSDADQRPSRTTDTEKPAEERPQGQRGRNPHQRVAEALKAQQRHSPEVHRRSEAHDGQSTKAAA